MLFNSLAACLLGCLTSVRAAKWSEAMVPWNMNTNQTATEVLDYSGEWENHTFNPSPDSWRFPVYTIILDKWLNGNPTNDNANDTVFEYDFYETGLRNGGDIQGLVDSLDYLQGMGVKCVYVSGTPYQNQPYQADQYSPLDYTTLDAHGGNIEEWRAAITEMHSRGMYIMFDLTVATLADLVGFKNFLNTSTTFSLYEHDAEWKTEQVYPDFVFTNSWKTNCTMPTFWGNDGGPVVIENTGCYDSDFDQYGDTEAFGDHPNWQRQLSKFASVQDRLRDWDSAVSVKLNHLACFLISSLDADAFRLDKATQMTAGFLAEWSQSVRLCAAKYNKNNFFIPGEITGGDSYGSIYIGRGRQPDQRPATFNMGYNLTGNESEYYLRGKGLGALDASAFQYSTYRGLSRWLGLDSFLSVPYDIDVDFVNGWHDMVVNEDLVNANTGLFDPRHMNGMTNHDVFRWPALVNGSQIRNLGSFITELLTPGLPLMYYGEEQDFYMLDSTADNYLFGRQSMGSSMAWYIHGCFVGISTQYEYSNFTNAEHGCDDFFNAQDHRDVAASARNVLIRFHEIRDHYPVITDGFCLTNIGNWTEQYYLPNSIGDNPTIVGLWSVHKQACTGQTFTTGAKNQDIWLLSSNMNTSTLWSYDCTSSSGIFAPSGTTFAPGTTIQNLMYPHDTITLATGVNASVGCIPSIHMDAYDFRVYVPQSAYVGPNPVITALEPGHDGRILSTGSAGGQQVQMIVEFSQEMNCDKVAAGFTFNSTTLVGLNASLGSYSCLLYPYSTTSSLVGAPGSIWQINATLLNVYDGIHSVALASVPTQAGNTTTTGYDNWFFRVGKADNPMVFPFTSNYTRSALSLDKSGTLQVEANAAGADMWRYSLDWGSTYSNWTYYSGTGVKSLPEYSKWSGTKDQEWEGKHAILQYWSKIAGSSAHLQHADYDTPAYTSRSFPHIFVMGPFNEWGYDAGARNKLKLGLDGKWTLNYVSEAYPSELQLNVWGINPDGEPDATWVYGTLINDTVIERTAPSTLSSNIFNISTEPPSPYLGWQIVLDDRTRRISFVPKGSHAISIVIYLLCLLIPIVTAITAVFIFKGSFYSVKFNQDGRNVLAKTFIPLLPFKKTKHTDDKQFMTDPAINTPVLSGAGFTAAPLADTARKTVLIATLEYNIEDWGIKIKIGGLGVMAQLMAQNLKHQDLIWVVPCVGDVNYPAGDYEAPMEVKILDQIYQIQVMIHKLNNITYVLLDAPVFRRQSTVEPYPARMDDLESAIFYSAWNQCIAETSRRFPVDLYHINDYHGALAPLYRLPELLPCALSLHNAEFQGLWPLRTPEERDEVCAVYNLSPRVCQKYVQFGNVFNLLHAAVSFLRIHQKGFGAVGVSTKYGKRSWARYPIFWGLKKIGKLPNPDPTDTGDIGAPVVKNGKVVPNEEFENNRKSLKRDAQEWAGLRVDPTADLLVFVGRWSMQKGIDLIADIVPTLVEEFNVQVITVGPIIDLYGKFAAEKLARLMEKYPDRVYSRPEFTALPPYIFSGADFTMIPSRDEPFGLVAVEFGRKGALGIGARVGGLGQMPGWWYTVESSATSHLLSQFESACRQALASNEKTRATLRAKSALQRFPVQEWIQKLDALQAGCIRMCKKKGSAAPKQRGSVYSIFPPDSSASFSNVGLGTHPNNSQTNLPPGFTNMPNASSPIITLTGEGNTDEMLHNSNPAGPEAAQSAGAGLRRQLSLGSRRGPGHRDAHSGNLPRDVNGELIAIDEEDVFDESDAEGDALHPDQVRGAFRGYGGFGTPSEDGYESEDNFDPQRSTMYEVMDDESIRDGGSSRNNFYGHSNASSSMSLSQMAHTPNANAGGFSSPPQTPPMSPGMGASQRNLLPRFANESRLSLASVMTGSNGKDFSLSKVQERFTDEDGMCLRAFSAELRDINPKNSKGELCIEEYLMKSEKSFFTEMKNEQLGVKSKLKKGDFSSRRGSLDSSRASSFSGDTRPARDMSTPDSQYHPHSPLFSPPKPTGIALFMQRGLGDWPLYTIFLSVGQILAATSYQLTLLSSTTSQSAAQLYTIGIIFMFATAFWWTMYRLLPSIWVLSAPYAFYAIAFFLIGLPGFTAFHGARDWINAIATWFYAVASASGSLYFALNFGDEGGSSTQVWIIRACLVQGTQQIWGSVLWYWGEKLSSDSTDSSLAGATQQTSPVVTAIVFVLAVFMALSTYLVSKGLPDFYRQLPGRIPAFYMSLIRRKLVIWFMIGTFLQNYWLSTLYGRSWRYLWSSTYINKGVIFAFVVLFFIIIWGAILVVMAQLTKTHSWIIPVFALGLGAPRWVQTLWAISNIGAALPWAGSAGPYLGRCLWLWLGVLDTIQGVGIGMVLLQTLTRAHVATTLMAGQMVGAVAMLIGRASSPAAIGPADTFLDFATWTPSTDGAAIFNSAGFWICLFCQLVIPIGYFVFFRKEQLSKP